MSLLEFITYLYNAYCPIAHTLLGDVILWLALHSPYHYVGQFFHDASGMAQGWAVVVDDLIDALGVPKGDH